MIYKKCNVSPKTNYPKLRGSLAGIQYPAFYQTKLDGELTWLFVNTPNGGTFMVNKYGSTREDSPQLRNLSLTLPYSVFIGELVWGWGFKGDLYQLLKNKSNNCLQFKTFDILEYDGRFIGTNPLLDRFEKLTELNAVNDLRFIVPKLVEHELAVKAHFHSDVDHEYEGGTVKNLYESWPTGPCSWVKMKYKDQSDYTVNMIDPTRERIEIYVPSTMNNSSKTGRIVNVGVKCCNKDKATLKAGDIVTIEHQGILASGSLRHPVFIKKV